MGHKNIFLYYLPNGAKISVLFVCVCVYSCHEKFTHCLMLRVIGNLLTKWCL